MLYIRLLKEVLLDFELLLANVLLLILRQRGHPLDLPAQSIGNKLAPKLTAYQFDMFVVFKNIFDELCQLLNPGLILGNQVLPNNIESLFVEVEYLRIDP
jgi:hypothetical protein